MNDYMTALHQRFYREPDFSELEEEIEEVRQEATVSGGAFEAEKAAIISVTKGGNTVTTTENTQT